MSPFQFFPSCCEMAEKIPTQVQPAPVSFQFFPSCCKELEHREPYAAWLILSILSQLLQQTQGGGQRGGGSAFNSFPVAAELKGDLARRRLIYLYPLALSILSQLLRPENLPCHSASIMVLSILSQLLPSSRCPWRPRSPALSILSQLLRG
jgi:hypothetical protein